MSTESDTRHPIPDTRGPVLPGLDLEAFHETLRNARQRLLDERNEQGWWTGELSSSALSTATAIVAMTLAKRNGCEAARDVDGLVERGVRWLIATQNEDGGWGDTDKSKSNISTTMLVWAAMGLVGEGTEEEGTEARRHEGTEGREGTKSRSDISNLKSSALARCETWLKQYAGSLEIPALVEAVMKRYGKDRTFSVPILTMCALCGRLGPVEEAATWKWVKQLPFEFAAFPRSWFKVLNLQVVSYALPALIAIGLVRHHHRSSWNPVARLARWMTRARVLRLLEQIQPPNGGFLEATPLTSFVSMSLAACGFARGPVVTRGIDFIIKSMRDDGSWPIDTNLATWVTTLSVNALAAGGKLNEHLNDGERTIIRDWILKQQYQEVHPYTGAAPGGWAWTDLPGGVPDADDTSGAVLALWNLADYGDRGNIGQVLNSGVRWLRQLQNRDGGIPTFCRGWGKLPFDESCPDLTAHAARAFSVEFHANIDPDIGTEPHEVIAKRWLATLDGLTKYLMKKVEPDGRWLPLWFGNQHAKNDENAIYGTSRVLVCQGEISMPVAVVDEAVAWICGSQNESGGWGGEAVEHCSIEETALAVEALVVRGDGAKPRAALVRGVQWLVERTARGTLFPASPIGFYFAKLWYYEKLYPIIFTVAALERVAALIAQHEDAS